MKHVLVAGLGSIGQRHVRNLRALYGTELRIDAYRVRKEHVVLTDQMTVARGATLEETYGLTVFDDLARALRERPDAVFVCNPTHCHVPVAREAVKAGCHVFIEKPLSDSLDGVKQLRAAALTNKRVVMVGCQLRFHPCIIHLRELIEQGTLGRIVSADIVFSEYLPAAHPWEDYRRGYAARRDLGGGVILCYMHEIDYLMYLLGRPRSVYALGGHLSSLDVDVEDCVDLLFACPARTAGEQDIPVHMHLDFVRRTPVRTGTIIGECGTAHMDLCAGVIEVHTAEGGVQPYDCRGLVRNQLFVDELRHFVACCNGTATPPVGLDEAVAQLNVACAAKASLAQHKRIALWK